VERTLGCLSRNCRMSKDAERKAQMGETLIAGTMSRLLVLRV
jgi:hypothetical protein